MRVRKVNKQQRDKRHVEKKYSQDGEGGVASEDQETLYDNEIVTLLEGHH